MRKTTGIAAALAAGALAAPGAAHAHSTPSPASVVAHTARADAALDRARTLFSRGTARSAGRAFAVSRRQLAGARRDAAELLAGARTDAQQVAAVRAQVRVAAALDRSIAGLTAALDAAEGRAERRLASAALADARARDRALGLLASLAVTAPEPARAGLARAIAALTADRGDEVARQLAVLTGADVAAPVERILVHVVQRTADVQGVAAATLAALLAGDELPEEARAQLQAALDALAAAPAAIAEALEGVADRVPAQVRPLIAGLLDRIRGLGGQTPPGDGGTDARTMLGALPAAVLAGIPTALLEGLPSGLLAGLQAPEYQPAPAT